MLKIMLPRQLLNFTDINGEYESNASTVQTALDELTDKYPFLKLQIFNSDRTLRNFVNVFVNEQMTEDLSEPVPPHSRVQIIVAVAGG
ncbi:MAG: MoaD/ThiS family protein [Pantoea ananatis]|uniref:MoaD/ThiS family protein n=1 Tax=Pantoea ananas TaxID=553 RepID=UPI0013BAF361|nr:MoaD/ThiS family protein [Pantoea ananatis]MCW1834737.1 MoaD/ThiS family protein [Pantoea ananatis]NEK83758.1 MoaD/ThiS family protein [Pantoea ananatis]